MHEHTILMHVGGGFCQLTSLFLLVSDGYRVAAHRYCLCVERVSMHPWVLEHTHQTSLGTKCAAVKLGLLGGGKVG